VTEWQKFDVSLPPGFYMERFSDHHFSGPYETLPDLIRTFHLMDYPDWGCPWTWDGTEMGGVPSLNPDDLLPYAHGPYRGEAMRALAKAQHDAELLVGDGTPERPYTQWSVVELFGPAFDRPGPNEGEVFGELWVVPTERTDEWADEKGAESRQIVDTFGYEMETTND
jgi:hypothetical protein